MSKMSCDFLCSDSVMNWLPTCLRRGSSFEIMQNCKSDYGKECTPLQGFDISWLFTKYYQTNSRVLTHGYERRRRAWAQLARRSCRASWLDASDESHRAQPYGIPWHISRHAWRWSSSFPCYAAIDIEDRLLYDSMVIFIVWKCNLAHCDKHVHVFQTVSL